jgi:tetratricopeptide (TPR) repeat protein
MPLFRWKHLFSPKYRAIRRADAARDRGDPAEAAPLYQAVVERWGANFGLLVQCGNALKDSGSYTEADRVYLKALEIRPNDADVFLQRGHLFKLSGDFFGAEELYRRASQLDPTLAAAHAELDEICSKNRGLPLKQAIHDAETRINLRTDTSMPASIIFHRVANQYRWRRG